MRKRFNMGYEFGQIAIEDVPIPIKSRDELPPVLLGLQWIFKNKEVRDEILSIVEEKVMKDKKDTGRPGMEIWQILVLGVVRLSLDCDYDRLEYLAHYDGLVRLMMGLSLRMGEGEEFGKIFHQKTICDNVKHIDEEMLKKINEIVEKAGSRLMLKKNEEVELKTDSYVLETDVHFPTDLNLLWDACRKSIELSEKICEEHRKSGWRKSREWKKILKSLMRSCGRVQRSGGKNKGERLKKKAKEYLCRAGELSEKVKETIDVISAVISGKALEDLKYFHGMMLKHIDLVERRILKDEVIPHEEKVFSLFEPHTQWINKGKFHNPIELGHKILLTTNQKGVIIDYRVMTQSSDALEVAELKGRILSRFPQGDVSLSFDKGFSSKGNRVMLESSISEVIMPKKGRLNIEDKQRQSSKKFIRLKNRHNAVESNINCLEHHGLNRCLDKGFEGFCRYVGIGVLAYNLHKIGNYLAMMRRREKYKQGFRLAA